MPKLTFYPLGNADCCLIDLAGGEKLLWDYADRRNPDDPEDLRIDLPTELRKDLKAAKRNDYDVVAFTHLDKDHYQGASEFFYLEHAKKYQGENRIKINDMWVPAAVITEEGVSDTEGKIIQAEARYRFKNGKRVRVFSRPEKLKKWLEDHGLTLDERKHLITDAGNLIPGFSKQDQGVEFFVHSPFAKRIDDGTVEDRNDDALVVQSTFLVDETETKLIMASDITHEIMADIVNITKKKQRNYRLEWDVFKLSHHCSYLSLGPEKGEDKTEPVGEVKWLFEEQGQDKATIVSTSKPIPKKGTAEDKDTDPPHRQAANYYREQADALDGEFKVTMEHPKTSAPEPLVINITGTKAAIEKKEAIGAAAVITRTAPRAG